MDASDCYTDEKSITVDSVREKIKNAKNSGLINRLLKYIDFDIEAIAKGNSKETFDEYKLLKLLYLMEHKGFIFEEQRYERVPILDLLSKPRLENVHSVFSDNDHHGAMYEYLCKSIEPFVKDLDGRCEKIQKVSSEWEQVVADMINYFVSDVAIDNLISNIYLLNHIYGSIKEIISPLLQANVKERRKYKEGVLDTFYNILLCYYFKCNEDDRIINACDVPAILPDSTYVEKYKNYENISVSKEFINDARDFLLGKPMHNPHIDKLIELVFYQKAFTDTDIKQCLYALDHVESYWKIIKKAKLTNGDADFCLGILVSIIQEIMLIKETKPQINNAYLGHNNAQKSLLRVISSPEEDNAIAFQVLITRLENRVCINTGGQTLIVGARLTQKEIYKIKKMIFSYQNIEDIVNVHKTAVAIFRRAVEQVPLDTLKAEAEKLLSDY